MYSMEARKRGLVKRITALYKSLSKGAFIFEAIFMFSFF